MQDAFRRLGDATANAVGTPIAFLSAVAIVAVWAVSGPLFAYSDSWQLVINTGTTIVTFLMVFLIQATQNRDTRILNLKIDELIRAVEGARTEFVTLDDLTDEELTELQEQFTRLAGKYAPLADDLAEVRREIDLRRSRMPH